MSDDGLTLEKLKINDRLIVLEIQNAAKMEILARIEKSVDGLVERVGIQNGRVSKLENWRSYVFGSMGALGGVCTVVALLIGWVKH